MSDTSNQKFVADLRALGGQGFMANDQYARVPYGLLYRAADAVEALVGIEQRLTDHIVQLAAERDEALRALGESRAAFADSEAKRAELEAVIQKVRGLIRERTFAETLATDFDGNLWPQMVNMADLRAVLDESPSVVLQDRDAAVWDEGAADGAWNYEHAAMIERGIRQAITNPYRAGDNT